MYANIIFKGKQCHLYAQQGSFPKKKLVGDTQYKNCKDLPRIMIFGSGD